MKDLHKNTESRVVDSYYEMRACACGGCRCNCSCNSVQNLNVQHLTTGYASTVDVNYRSDSTAIFG